MLTATRGLVTVRENRPGADYALTVCQLLAVNTTPNQMLLQTGRIAAPLESYSFGGRRPEPRRVRMAWFRCCVRGENFPGQLVCEAGLVGFYVTRFVEAA